MILVNFEPKINVLNILLKFFPFVVAVEMRVWIYDYVA